LRITLRAAFREPEMREFYLRAAPEHRADPATEPVCAHKFFVLDP
jgi:hypothetical protein